MWVFSQVYFYFGRGIINHVILRGDLVDFGFILSVTITMCYFYVIILIDYLLNFCHGRY